MSSGKAALSIEGLSVTFHGAKVTDAVKDVTLQVDEGDTVAVVGRSGDGKSTLCYTVMGINKAGSGVTLTGGIELVHTGYIEDWPGFCSKLSTGGRAGHPSPSRRIWQLLPPPAKHLVAEAAGGRILEVKEKSEIASALGSLLTGRNFYQQVHFLSLRVPARAQRLLQRGLGDMSDWEIKTLNRLLFEASYPREVARSQAFRLLREDSVTERRFDKRFDRSVLQKVRGHLAFMSLQDPRAALNPFMSLGAQIAEACTAFRDDGQRLDRAGVRKEVRRIWQALGLFRDPYKTYQTQLSGGETVRAMLAIVLATQAKLVMLDEPTANLDPISEHYVLKAIEENLADCTKILVTHKVTPIRRLRPSRELVMLEGRLVPLSLLDYTQTARSLQELDKDAQVTQPTGRASGKLVGSAKWVNQYVCLRRSLYDYSLLSVYDITDWQGFCAKVSRDAGQKRPTPGRRIWELLTPASRQIVVVAAAGAGPCQEHKIELAKALNTILSRIDFYREDDFPSVLTPPEVERLRAPSLLTASDIVDWPALCLALSGTTVGDRDSSCRKVWELLPQHVRETIDEVAGRGELGEQQKSEVVSALNAILERHDLRDATCCSSLVISGEARELMEMPSWELSDAQTQRLNRLLLEAILAPACAGRCVLIPTIPDTDVQRLNRLLLIACYPDEIAGRLADLPERLSPSVHRGGERRLLLSVANLCVTFGKKVALNDVAFELYAGEHLGIIGMSGSGKTSLIKCVMGEGKGDPGSEITFYFDERRNGISPSELQRSGRWRNRIQMVTQQPDRSLHPAQTIRQTIMSSFDLYHRLNRTPFRGDRSGALRKILAKVELDDPELAEEYPWALSGGQKRRAELANVLAALGYDGAPQVQGQGAAGHALPPRIVALDEVTEGLDLALQAEILGRLREMQQPLNLTFLTVSHDFRVVAELCHRCIVLFEGLVVEEFDMGAGPVLPYTQALANPTRIPPHMGPQDPEARAAFACPMLDMCRCYADFQPDARCDKLPPQLIAIAGKPRHRVRCWRYAPRHAGGNTV